MKSIAIAFTAIILVIGVWFISRNNTTKNESLNTSEVMDDSMIEDVTQDTTNILINTKTLALDASSFKFSQEEIRVKKGDKVKITLTSIQGFHDWVVDEFDAKTNRVEAGETATVEFTADKSGTFEYYCSVGNHRQLGMVGKLIVE